MYRYELRPAVLSTLNYLALVFLLNTGIALFLSVLLHSTTQGFWLNFIYSQAIGLSITLLSLILSFWQKSAVLDLWTAIGAIGLGSILGLGLAHWIIYGNILLLWREPQTLHIALSTSVVFGSAISFVFYQRMQLFKIRSQLAAQQMLQEKHLLIAQLQVLQAQIEPHFLFNTLSTVLNLIENNPTQASQTLRHLTRYLRATLQRTRIGQGTLADEIEILRAYLDIAQLRLSTRLSYEFIIEPDCLTLAIPPLLLQPLVENAVQHGIEPCIAGGQITVSARLDDAQLIIQIIDTGCGLQTHTPTTQGVGLQNVRQRLQALYGAQASLQLQANQPSGVKVRVILPCPPPSLPTMNPCSEPVCANSLPVYGQP